MCAIDQIPPPRAGKAMLRARTCIGEARVIIDGLARDDLVVDRGVVTVAGGGREGVRAGDTAADGARVDAGRRSRGRDRQPRRGRGALRT